MGNHFTKKCKSYILCSTKYFEKGVHLKMDRRTTTSEILENLSHIKTITNYKTEYCKQTSTYFIIWGCIWIIAFSLTLTNLDSFSIGIIWGILGIMGGIITLVTYFKQEKSDPMPLFLRTQLKYAWFGIFMILGIFIFLISSNLLSNTFNSISMYMVLLVSIMYILLGIVLTKEIFLMGFWLIILGIITFSVFPDTMNIIFAFIGGGSLLLTGVILKRKGQGNE